MIAAGGADFARIRLPHATDVDARAVTVDRFGVA